MSEKIRKPSKKEIKTLSEIMKSATSVELHVEDFEPVRRFYTKIGFEIILDIPGQYLVLRMGNAILNFWGDNGQFPKKQLYFRNWPRKTKKGYGVEIIIPVKNVHAYYRKIKNKVKVIEKLTLQPWQEWDFRIADPNGYYLRFNEAHDWVFESKGYTSDEDR